MTTDKDTLEWAARWIEDSLKGETNERVIEFGKNMAMTIRAAALPDTRVRTDVATGCDYRNSECSHEGVNVDGRWRCNNHLNRAEPEHRCPHFEPKGEDTGGAYNGQIISDVTNSLLDPVAKERLAAKPTAWYSLLTKQLIQRIANLRVMLTAARAADVAGREPAADTATEIARLTKWQDLCFELLSGVRQRVAPSSIQDKDAPRVLRALLSERAELKQRATPAVTQPTEDNGRRLTQSQGKTWRRIK